MNYKKIFFVFTLFISLISFQFLFVTKDVFAEITNYYFNNAGGDNDFNNLSSWWLDEEYTVPAISLPSTADDVVHVRDNINTSSIDPITLNHVYIGNPDGSDEIYFYMENITSNVTVYGYGYVSGYVDGNATFYDGSYNNSDVSGDGHFYENSYNELTIGGDATFYSAVEGVLEINSNYYGGTISGQVLDNQGDPVTEWVFNNGTYNNSTIDGIVTFNDTSANQGSVYGSSITFNDESYNIGYIYSDSVVFNEDSVASAGGQIESPLITFNGSSKNKSILYSDQVVFNNNSINYRNLSVTEQEVVSLEFNDNSKNLAVIYGEATFNDQSQDIGWSSDSAYKNWRDLDSSNNGQIIAAVPSSDYIYISSNGGQSFASKTNSGQRNWRAISVSFDGQKIVAVVNGGYIYTSDDFGETWTERTSAGSRNWQDVISSYDGQKIVAVVNNGYIYVSNDFGETWTQKESSRSWIKISSSDDGQKIFASTNGASIYRSLDGGENWSQVSYIGLATVSGNGSRLFVSSITNDNDQVVLSLDNGNTWQDIGPVYLYLELESSYDGYDIVGARKNSVGLIFLLSQQAPISLPVIDVSNSTTTATTSSISLNLNYAGGENVTEIGIEYGTSDSYGSATSSEGSFDESTYSFLIEGLECETSYNFRGYAINSFGTATTSDDTFTTGQCSETEPEPEPEPDPEPEPEPENNTTQSNNNSSSGTGTRNRTNRLISPVSSVVSTNTKFELNQIINDQNYSSLIRIIEILTGIKILDNTGSVSANSFVNSINKPLFNRDLTINSSGTDVVSLQNFLIEKGYSIPVGATGYFGEQTKQALIKFQNDNKILPAIGYFGPITRSFISNI